METRNRIAAHIEAELRERAQLRESRRHVDLAQYAPIAFGDDGVQRELLPEERNWKALPPLRVVPAAERAEEDRILAAGAVGVVVGVLVGCAVTVAVMGVL